MLRTNLARCAADEELVPGRVSATPAVVGDRTYYRGEGMHFCFGRN